MSIDDIDYLKVNSIKQSYNFLVDSKDRDKTIYPDPNHYVITFDQPFRNVIGLEISDYSIPRTMFTVDIYNNIIYIFVGSGVDDPIFRNGFTDETYDISLFQKLELPIGDYSINSFIPYFNNYLNDNGLQITLNFVSNPPDLTNNVYFSSPLPFIIDMNMSTINDTIGFDLNIRKKDDDNNLYTYRDYSKFKKNLNMLYESKFNPVDNTYNIYSPGSVYFIGEKYCILRCPEIEEHSFRSLSYSKYSLGIAKFRLNSLGYNDTSGTYNSLSLREFHPIGKLSKMTLKFQTSANLPYDFKGINHYIIFTIYYYEPKLKITTDFKPILNPNYKANYNNYLHSIDDQDDEYEVEEEELSLNNLDNYKKNEVKYSN
jgi:hypothetical protein